MKIVINPIRPALCEAAQDFHLLVRLQSEPQAGFKRTPLNLVLVLDRSGSMDGSKLTEAKRCAIDLVRRMSPTDQVGVVQYDDAVDTVMPLSTVEQVGGVIEASVVPWIANTTDAAVEAPRSSMTRMVNGSSTVSPVDKASVAGRELSRR